MDEEDCCMCGDSMDHSAMHSGHQPVSMRDYYADQQTWKRMLKMNTSTYVFLFNPNTRAILATYDEKEGEKPKPYTFKTIDKSIKVGDLVVVPTSTRHNLTVVKVVDVDIDVDIDTPHEIKWVIGKVDLETHQKLIDMELEAIAAINQAEIRKRRVELAKKLQDNTEGLDFTKLQISHASNVINGEVVTAEGTPAE